MKNILLVFPFLSGCFIIAHLGLGNTSPTPDAVPEKLLSSTSLPAPLPCDASRMIAYNMAFPGSRVHTVVTPDGKNPSVKNESVPLVTTIFSGY